MNIPFLLGPIMLGGFFFYSGIHHFMGLKMMAGYAKSKGVPMPSAAVAGTGVMLTADGLSLLLGLWPTIGIALLVVVLLGITPSMHDFWVEKDPQKRMGEMTNFTKNFALLAALLMLLMIPQPWPMSLNLSPWRLASWIEVGKS